MKLLSVLFTCIFLFQSVAYAQPDELSFDRLTIENGISNNTIFCIHQDKKGFIWIGTNDGLNCFDGLEFTVFNHNARDSCSITHDQINSIAEDDQGNLWIGLWIGGLNMYERSTGRFKSFLYDPLDSTSISSNNIWTVYIDRSKNIWAGTVGRGLNLYHPQSNSFRRFIHQPSNPESLSDNSVSVIFEDRSGNLWIGTENGGLNLFDRNTQTFKVFEHQPGNSNSIASDKINTLFEDDHHNLWIGTIDNGISVLSPDLQTFTNYPAGNAPNRLNCNNVRSFLEDDEGIIWIGTDGGGINFFDPLRKTFSHLLHNPDNPKGISSNVIFNIYKSKEGIIWVGTYQGGLNVYDKKKYKFHPYHETNLISDRLSYKSVMSIFEDSKGFIWIGTDGGGLNRYNPQTSTFTYFLHDPLSAKSISGNVIKSIFEDSRGNIWFGTHANGLNLFNREKEEFIHFKHDPSDPGSLSQNDVWDIIEDTYGNLWIGTLSGGLNLLDRETMTFISFKSDGSTSSLCSNNIFSMIQDKRQGGLWVGTKFGLSYFDIEANKFKTYVHDKDNPESLNNDEIIVLYQDSNYNVWIGTNKGGLNLYNQMSDDFVSYGVEEGFISNTISGIVEDNDHNLWISTNRGISMFNPVDKSCLNYTNDDGLQSNEFLGGSVFKKKNGDLIFGGVEGFSIIHPESIENNECIPEVIITKLLVSNKEIKPGDKDLLLSKVISETDELTFNYMQSVITFEFTALNYTNPEKNQFAYKLEGFDKDWNYIATRRNVTFTNLEPKSYIFRVKASNNDGVWNEQGTSVIFHVLPPYWKTWWFRMVIILVLIFIVISWYTYRIRTMRMQKIKLESLVKQRTIELADEKETVEKQNDELLEKQNEILKQNVEIREMSEKVHQADEEKFKFFTNISHEIRTPITLILSPIEKLKATYLNDSQLQNQLSRIHRNALNLKRLVNQILDFRKIDSNSYPLRAYRYDLVAAIKEITAAFYDIATQNRIHFSFISEYKSIEAWIDFEKIDKIMYNLLSNAFRYTPSGGEISVKVSIKTPAYNKEKSRVSYTSGKATERGYIVISVKDSGIGIPANQLEKIFERFYQTDQSMKNFQGGTGIGLTIARSLAEIHYGKITVESEVGKGSCFSVWLPLGSNHLRNSEIVMSDSLPKQSWNENLQVKMEDNKDETEGKATDRKKTRILIVEDNAELRFYVKDCLKDEFDVIEATNGKEGLKQVRKTLPGIIVSDIMMPEMDGLEFCREIKTSIETSHIPVILLTAKSAQEHKLVGLESGADDYITKPFDYKELKIKLNNLCRTRELLKDKFSKELVLKPQDITLTSTDETFIRKAMEIVENNLSDSSFNISQFIADMGVSRSVFYMKIKELTNLSVNEFTKTLRLKRAAQLLLQNELSVSEISYIVGFNDPNHFGKCFKKQFGVSPGNFLIQNSTHKVLK